MVLGWRVPYTAAQLLWINLVTNGFQDIALAVEPGEAHVLRRKPYGLRARIFDRTIIQHSLVVALVFGVGCLVTYRIVWLRTEDLAQARTAAMTTMVLLQMFHAFSCRSLVTSIFRHPWSTNPWLILGSLGALGAHFLVVYALPEGNVFSTKALPLSHWVLILPFALLGVLAMEVSKWMVRRRGLDLT